MSYLLLTALGLMFFAVSFVITNPSGRMASVILASVLFLIAAVIEALGSPW